MRMFILALFSSCLLFSYSASAETASAPVAVASSAPVVTPVPPPIATTAPAGVPTIAVAVPSAPPQWAQELLLTAEKLPVVGPWVAKLILWLGILAGILTTLTAAILGIVKTLIGAANLTGLTEVATWLGNFQNGQVMYWLKFFSLFNAPASPPSTAPTVNT